ncbi:McrC family protein [Romboutsia ilealis]|uniref:McrC family protein n=1 Tax=Romboutsia ilealis TaxID=1115758 RepID=UPI002572552D|nr:hypothetical protein [Romboutsia ilealis]
MKLREFGKFKELPKHIDNRNFRNFINECWNNRYSVYDDSSLLNENNDNREQRFLTFDGNKIKARNYIGFINYEGEEITIYPKIFDTEIVNENLDNYLLTNLMYWLRDSEKIKLPLVESSLDFRHNEDFIEIFIYLFAKYTLELIYSKPYNTYEEIEEELEFLKGRLNTNIYLKENISTGRWNKFNCTYEPYLHNNKLNQIIKYVAKILMFVSKKEETIVMLNNINFILDEVEDISCTIYDCNEVKLNRLQEDYNIVLNFCEMFLGNSSIARCKDENKLNFCFLVPMELVFEDFIFNFIKNNFSKDYKEITKQKSNLFLSEVYVDESYLGRAFNLRQDIFLKAKDNSVKILDTKYKVLDFRDYPKFGISQSDMYQMTSYAFRGGYKDLGLIYPKTKEIDNKIKYSIKSPFIKENINLDVYINSLC